MNPPDPLTRLAALLDCDPSEVAGYLALCGITIDPADLAETARQLTAYYARRAHDAATDEVPLDVRRKPPT